MIRKSHYGVVSAVSVLLFCHFALTEAKIPVGNAVNSGDNALPANKIALKMMERLKQRDTELLHYSEARTYEVKSDDKKPAAIINAVMDFSSPPAAKDFRIVSKSNASSASNMVYDHETKAEKDALSVFSQKQASLTSENYNFAIQGQQAMNGIQCYVLELQPKRLDKMLLKGKLWVSTDNFDLLRMEGTPAKSPSIWIKNISFVREFQNVNGFWLPREDDSTIDVRLYGRIKVKIDHHDLKIAK
ncbi:MAG TPA: outer membrane lipoprotein-sorting protein [Blastocatellia bacterium]|nr:outer membrane lipoprotein-sorting protein [Blastocatellia bacterium]